MKTDARVRYTQMRIKEAFLACLAEKPVNKITVKELCDMAEINRATFYKHYADPFDLLDKMEEESLAWLERIIKDDQTQQGVLLTLLCSICAVCNPYIALISANGDPRFAGRISELFYREYRPHIAQYLPNCTADEQTAAYLFIVGGCGHLLSEWLRSDRKTPPEEVAARLEGLTEVFIRAYRGTL